MSSYLATSPQVLALLQDAKETPQDDTPRLVLADWLDEHGDADRAEFIRLQCRLAPSLLLADELHRRPVLARAEQLLNRHGGAWIGSLWRWWLSPRAWHRGLLSSRLPRGVEQSALADILPWIDTALLTLAGRKSLRRATELIISTPFNHLNLDLDLRQSRRDLLLDFLRELSSQQWLPSLSIDWPLRLQQRREEDGVLHAVPTMSTFWLLRLLRELPVGRHLSHLASAPDWSQQQTELIRAEGVEPACADPRLWMHSLPLECFSPHTAAAPLAVATPLS